MASGEWFLPGGSSPINGSGSFSTADFSRSRRSSAVLLNRRNNAIGPEGLYRCDVIEARNIIKSLFIGIYTMDRGGCVYNNILYEIKLWPLQVVHHQQLYLIPIHLLL